jgi:Mg/Co/Ni transporter MgtE
VTVPVSPDVFEGIEAVRQSGITNMLDRERVAELAEAMGFDEAARWVREHRDLYARAVFHGFEVTP